MDFNNPLLSQVFAAQLSVRGAGSEYHKLCGIYRSKAEANAAVTDGHITLGNTLNLALVAGHGLMLYSKDMETWISAKDWTGFAIAADSYIALDGDNDYFKFTGGSAEATSILDWSKDWSLGMTVVDFSDMGDNKRMTVASNGGNHLTLQRGHGQDAFYISGDNGVTSHGANVWYNLDDNRRILFIYNSTTRRIRYLVGDGEGGYNQRADLNIDQGVGVGGGAGTPDNTLSFGKGEGMFVNFHGAVDKVITRDAQMSDVQVAEFFSNLERDYTQLSFYGDLTSYINAGEDAYPLVTDAKGALTGGEMFGGSAASFKLTPTE